MPGVNSLKDEELAGRIGLQAKELNKLMAVLTNDRLVHMYVISCLCRVLSGSNDEMTLCL